MSVRPRAFFRNDLDYAPFGLDWLRGLTPARLAIVVALCLLATTIAQQVSVGLRGFGVMLQPLPGDQVPRLLGGAARRLLAALPLVLLILAAERRTSSSQAKTAILTYSAAVAAGAVLYAAIMVAMLVWGARGIFPFGVLATIPGQLYIAAVPGALWAAVLFLAGREREATKRLLQERLVLVAAERQAAEARLRLLDAQIEPHFLFNSLASVKRLYEQDRGSGKNLLGSVRRYLQASVGPGTRHAVLADQAAMARSYLEIFQERMGERLRYRVEIPVELERAEVPSLMLGTLVENAVKHGIGPRDAGGSVEIIARSEGGQLVIEVSDDGLGLRGESGTGVGLANTRARLDSLYGEAGDVDLARNAAGGVTARIRIPLRFATQDELSDPKVEARSGSRSDTERPAAFTARLGAILTWKHWAWAIGIGFAMANLHLLYIFTSVFELASLWARNTVVGIAAACGYMLAIVIAEASRSDGKMPSASRYFIAGLAASVAAVAISVSYPVHYKIRATPQGAPIAKMMGRPDYNHPLARFAGYSLFLLLYGALGMTVYVWVRRSNAAAQALAHLQVERAEAERRLVDSRLEAIQAEADPSFVFTTLESIERTYDRDPAAAEAMLDELIAFLRAAIPRLRADKPKQEAAREPATA